MKFLFVVEKDFLKIHVGVRRVIFFYLKKARELGASVTFASPFEGQLFAWRDSQLSATQYDPYRSSNVPFWTSDGGFDHRPSQTVDGVPAAPEMTRDVVHPSGFDYSLITNPWLCVDGLPSAEYSCGLVYDMIPNLVACGAVHFGRYVDVYKFAHDHDVGYKFYLDHCREINAISDSTRRDFAEFYGLSSDKLAVTIPFEVEGSGDPSRPRSHEPKLSIVLVNVLDFRKNFEGIRRALLSPAVKGLTNVTVVGAERIPQTDALNFMGEMASSGSRVQWYRDVSSSKLDSIYSDSDLLIFPSFYEGLGLPILEAQSQGTPVISSNNSSSVEINLNQDLLIDPTSADDISRKIVSVIENRAEFQVGEPLISNLQDFLSSRNAVSMPR